MLANRFRSLDYCFVTGLVLCFNQRWFSLFDIWKTENNFHLWKFDHVICNHSSMLFYLLFLSYLQTANFFLETCFTISNIFYSVAGAFVLCKVNVIVLVVCQCTLQVSCQIRLLILSEYSMVHRWCCTHHAVMYGIINQHFFFGFECRTSVDFWPSHVLLCS